MLPKNRKSTHPGIILWKEYLEPSNITQTQFARHVGLSLQTINEIIKGKRNITPETAWLFAKSFGTTPELWMNLQMNYDLTVRKPVDKLKALHLLKLSAA
ncbi:MAG TPA: HigA family addiction module antitoxin [Leptospiraceae bacterium]|nr:HigA family addiction module antitoxin [Leptospiraceae bacterium]HMW04061.1 HigA family addiction module antitoxin [Leptospiraceae bacterium]HMX30951.1 HigA family addiction module antitoxin [Leptospiraceae bacterium]HMY30055.1 HigA family addiction module antitoxin [Leptospiraceae bacterium]HMZ62758.1 HigA family addiction module antitoxin [Leptospiraceae bacterium]